MSSAPAFHVTGRGFEPPSSLTNNIKKVIDVATQPGSCRCYDTVSSIEMKEINCLQHKFPLVSQRIIKYKINSLVLHYMASEKETDASANKNVKDVHRSQMTNSLVSRA